MHHRWVVVALLVVACKSSKGKPPPEAGSAAAADAMAVDAAPAGLPTFDQIVSTATAPTQIASLVATDPGQLAWLMFLYVNWPAMPGKRGVPDPSQPLGATPTVFQTWKEVHEVYLAGGAAPLPWDDGGPKGPPTLSLTEIDGTTLEDTNGKIGRAHV